MYDLIIQNGQIIDPQTQKITIAHLCVKDGSIVKITRETLEAEKIIDASGKYVSPGFIDIHAHIEGNSANGNLMCQQGVTTVLNGNCGMGPENPCEFMANQNKTGFIINQLELVGATMLRERVGMIDPYTPLSAAQLAQANSLLEQQLQDGGAGLSFGLEYCPGTSHEEVITLSRTAARYGKLVAIHTRSDLFAGLASLEEAIDINRLTGAPVQISHVVYQYGFGMMRPALEIIDRAVAQGYDISCDSGMYTSFATHIGTAVFNQDCFEKWKCTYDSLLAASGPYAGQRMTKEIYEDMRSNYPHEVAIALIGCPHEINMAFELPYMMVSSDCGVNSSDDTSKGHPQDAGTFPRFIDQLVKQSEQLTLPDAIRRMTVLPAKRMGLDHKGRMTVGSDADLVIFELNRVKDNSRFSHEGRCDALPDGIAQVIVGGKVAVDHQSILCNCAGRAIPTSAKLWTY